jgi:hypothetical protein
MAQEKDDEDDEDEDEDEDEDDDEDEDEDEDNESIDYDDRSSCASDETYASIYTRVRIGRDSYTNQLKRYVKVKK